MFKYKKNTKDMIEYYMNDSVYAQLIVFEIIFSYLGP